MTDTLTDFDAFLGTLELADLGDDTFTGRHPAKVAPRTFGGQILSQAIVASGNTVPGSRDSLFLHAAHTHFINGGDVSRDIEYRVTRLRDTRNVANRMVSVEQDGTVLALMQLAYQTDARNPLVHGDPAPQVPGPEGLPNIQDTLRGYEDVVTMFVEAPQPMDMRFTNDPAWIAKGKGLVQEDNRVWIRAAGDLPDDQVIHDAAMAYASDTTILDSIITRHGLSWGFDRIMAVTLNQSLWFHRRVRFDDYNLYASHSTVADGGRGMSNGQFFDRAGVLVASTTQEGVLKYFPARSAQ
ncbi:Choloyl-CoA hydrolase OS=Tsukamurella paurometabola (strain ATCC 8368 / DSM / CCUG 35730 / CIP 100753 / JCM 10117 / KCTC 9821 / NBRC 16120 / NCIMB 702349/ NCTC 13040) OX=521096 GN=Tpau_2489 PE=3 SV=1 [Tsukamurella paurometabola]|uniref:Choloyl-CoA hydrolase n=1 Tax=Tsukamurella paurometabola (strain ATCC 8368 / DSM 20162 / CCUG 35730 / CIP 100753 / JCM 10117 / KCTC 9821 / NBRC 16120 / NCIMB 702349 / NCTC 13040) TaxID=521096 RepID=D5URN8_TSUPD|nr:acyl-CoA thioesterase II [Tsukamurella paurometabola]ADG79093.1 Choloyl-CoA hydrolase [Tsukamurella paurometabola DSM 20162]SUP34051.1 Acyl-CoA thioesterase 2 [Tsukamurella paurometabola]